MTTTLKARSAEMIAADLEDAKRTFESHLRWNGNLQILLAELPFDLELPESFSVDHFWSSCGDINLIFPRSEKAISEFGKLCKTLDPEVWCVEILDMTVTSGDFRFDICKHTVGASHLRVIYRATVEGARCKLVQIGTREEVTTHPIYEVVCPDGAAEATWKEPEVDRDSHGLEGFIPELPADKDFDEILETPSSDPIGNALESYFTEDSTDGPETVS